MAKKQDDSTPNSIRTVADLTPDARNANKGTERGRAMLEASLREFGAGRSILIDKNGKVIAGNKTLEEAAGIGMKDVVVVQTDGTKIVAVQRMDLDLVKDEKARRLAYADNRVGQVDLDFDPEQLLADVQSGLDLSALWSEKELEELFSEIEGDEGAGGEAPEPQIDLAAELQKKWGTERGQVWEVGRHRLMCGDSTSAEDVGRLMGGGRAEMVWTDPPYGVAVGDKNKYLNSVGRSNRVEKNLTNDTLGEPELVQMLGLAFDCAVEVCLAGAAWYVAAPPGPLHVLFGQALKDRGIWRQTIQWVKNNATFSPMGVDYHWRAEPIFYGWLPNAGHRYHGGRKQDTVWEIDRPSKSPEHPTMKPVELIARAVRNSSLKDETVYDPFLGSGTTMVAAQQLDRICYGMEIDPGYCAVVLERMQGMGITGVIS